VSATLHEDGAVTVGNVPSYRYRQQVLVDVPGHGPVRGDIAWGGNWFFLVSEHGQRIELGNREALTEYTWAMLKALEAQGITGENGAPIDL
ncbi:proline racemase family protein, partial [Bacillus mobilis]